jgi:hypothetical protein
MRRILYFMLVLILSLSGLMPVVAQYQTGDTVMIDGKLFALLSENLIANPGFEEGYTGWTDATSSRNTLTAAKFNLVSTGGVNNSQYLVGTTNESSTSSGSIGTSWPLEAGKTYMFSYYVKYLPDAANKTGNEPWLKVSLSNSASSSNEPKILLDGAKVEVGGQWTLNSVGFTNAGPAYGFLAARFRWLGNRMGFDEFSLFEAYELPNTDSLIAVIAEAERVYRIDAVGAAALKEVLDHAKDMLSSMMADEVWQAILDLQEAIFTFKLANASSDNPLDMTRYIVNQGFHNNTNDGWTGGGTVNFGAVEFYQRTFDFFQELSGLPAGKYKLKAQGFERPRLNDNGVAYRAGTEVIYARLYAQNTQFGAFESPFNSLYQHSYSGTGSMNGYVHSMAAAEIMFTHPTERYYEMEVGDILLGANDVLVIGARSNFQQTGYWTMFDNFRLEYHGLNASDIVEYINSLIARAEGIVSLHMQEGVLETLTSALNNARTITTSEPLVIEQLYSTNTDLQNAIAQAQLFVDAYAALKVAIDSAITIYADGSGNQSVDFQSAIDTAQETYDDTTKALETISAATRTLYNAIFTYRTANATGAVPTVVTHPFVARGATMALGRSTVSGVMLSALAERGFCWSTDPEPSVLDNRTTSFMIDRTGQRIYRMDDLQPSTVYYVRAYAITNEFAVGYGEVVKVITIPKGNITYTMTSGVTGDHRVRIEEAVSSAVNYWNNLTSIRGLHLTVNFGSGTPTAEASYGGWMRFGPNPSFQRTGTALHEMNHTMGVGTHWYWNNTTNSPLKVGGVWQGERATRVVRFLENDPNATLRGDATHMWPYGINGAHEDTGSELLYIGNSLVTQAIAEDGLPPTNGFSLPAYTFESEPGVKYYLKSESNERGLTTSFLVEGVAGQLVYQEMTKEQALEDDFAAWYIDFNPINAFYRIRNVATGKYITYRQSGINGVGTVTRTSPTAAENFHMMGARVNKTIGSGATAYTMKGYWIIRPEHTLTPPAFVALTEGRTAANTFNIANSSETQRWVILSEDDLGEFYQALPTGLKEISESNIVLSTDNKMVRLEKLIPGSDVYIYDSMGKLYHHASGLTDSYAVAMERGLYIVVVRNINESFQQKIIVF